MKKTSSFKFFLIACFIVIGNSSFAQTNISFDIKKAYEIAKDKGIDSKLIDEYVDHQRTLYLNNNNSKTLNTAAKTINKYYTLDNVFLSPQNSYCPNAGFELGTFINWTGSTGNVTDGATTAAFPVYTSTGTAIVNPAGNNTSLVNELNFHTIMTTPAINNIYPNCVGYDSVACRIIGTQTISEIPVVNPNGGPASVRLNCIRFSNDVGGKLTYNMSLNPNNKNFSLSYALVLQNGTHPAYQQPYFSVKVKDQNGNLVPGCSTYTVTCDANLTNTASPLYDPSWRNSVIATDVMYRKWSTYAFDFSNYPTITSVSVEFYVGGCSIGGHFGYAYVDAYCGQGGAISSLCAGSNTSVLTAPLGYSTYQWTGPSGPVSAAVGGNSSSATITPVSAGQVFTCNVTSSNGCPSVFQTTVSITTVSITGVNSTPSCPQGNSGTANVTATGSSSGYNYQWINSLGTTVSSSITAIGLAPGIYTIIVSSPLCGSATTTVQVSNSMPNFYTLQAPFCNVAAWITAPNGSNYKWYTASPLALIAGATSSSLTINNPVNGANYYLVYTTASGCKDSINYVLAQTTTGGSIYTSNIKSICAANSNGYAIVNLQTSATPASYSYSVTGPSGYTSTLNNTASLKDSVSNLSVGIYTATVFDGQCIYNSTFTVNPLIYSYTVTPLTSTICAVGSSSLVVDFGNTVNTCGLVTTNCSSPNIVSIGNGSTLNTSTGSSNPCPYGNYYKNIREQYLFTAAELTAAGVLPGTISSISFMVNSILPLNTTGSSSSSTYIGTLPNYSIKMKCSSATSLTNFDNTGLTQVYNGNYTPVVGVNTHVFNQSYGWDGTSSLIVDVCYTRTTSLSSSYYTSNPVMPHTTTGTVKTIYYSSDVTLACGNSSGSTSLLRPNIKFGNCGNLNRSSFTYSWVPNTGLASSTSYSTIANPTTTTTYTVYVNPIGETNCVQPKTTTIFVNSITQPTISASGPYCDNFSPKQLSANPLGGVWSSATIGSSVTSTGQFAPSSSLIGNNKLYYTFGNAPCIKKDSVLVNVIKFIPATIAGTVGPYCIYDPTVSLQSVSQNAGGTWSGNGVAGSSFSPIIAGSGTTVLSYSTDPIPNGLCPDAATLSVLVNPKPEANVVLSNLGGCNYPWTVNFSSSTVNTGIASWDFGDGSPLANGLFVSHEYSTPGTYTAVVTYTDNVGCVDTTTALSAVTIYSVPIADFEPSLDVTTLIDAQIEFTNHTTNGLNNTYNWSFGDSASSVEVNPTYLYTNSGEYNVTLIALSSDGCRDSITKKIIINPDVVLYVPNAFTPGNNDGLNDVFQIYSPPTGIDFNTFSLLIYDRWGELVYKTNDITMPWTGAKNNAGLVLPQGVYVWKINFQDLKKKHYERMGHVSLLHK